MFAGRRNQMIKSRSVESFYTGPRALDNAFGKGPNMQVSYDIDICLKIAIREGVKP